jgi:FkbM family methyltransferase
MARTNVLSSLRRLRFDLAEALVLCTFVGYGVLTLTAPSTPRPTGLPIPAEAEPLRVKYGPERNSQFAEEWIVRDFFQDKRGGVFLDVGANHYRKFSTTYFLEKQLGWSGLAVEPLREFEADYRVHRPNTRFMPFFVSDVSNQAAKMYVIERDRLVTSGDQQFTQRYVRSGESAKEVVAPTITLNDLLAAEHVSSIDFLSMDIELWEPKALAGFDIERYRPTLVCIEVHDEVRQQIFDYFARHGYVAVGKYLRSDEHNVYFTPLASRTVTSAAD